MNEKVQLTFDDDNRLRALEPEKFEQTKEMEKEASSFATSPFEASGRYGRRRPQPRPARGLTAGGRRGQVF